MIEGTKDVFVWTSSSEAAAATLRHLGIPYHPQGLLPFFTLRERPAHLAECLQAGFNVLSAASFTCKEESSKEAAIADEGCVELEEVGTQMPSEDMNDVANDCLTLCASFCVQSRDRLEVAWPSCFWQKRCLRRGARNEALLQCFAYNVV